MDQDAQTLETLKIFHYVFAGLTALGGCFPFIHLTVGIVIVTAGQTLTGADQTPPPAFAGWLFIAFATAFILLLWTLAALVFAAGRRLGQRRGRTFCMVVAGVLCAMVPMGTVLGVFTILTLQKPAVRVMFGEPSS